MREKMNLLDKVKKSLLHWNNWKFWVAVIALTACAANLLWIILDTSPALWDIAGHSQRAALAADLFKSGHWRELLLFDGIYPPLTYFVTGFLFLILGWHVDVPQLSLILYLAIYLFSIAVITNHLFKDQLVTVLAVLLSLFYPLLAHFTRIYDLDFPLTVLITAAAAALLLSNNFRNRKWAILTGLAVAGALLTKWTAVIFLVGPVLVVLLPGLKNRNSKNKIILNVLLGLVAILAVAGPWYLAQGSDILASAATTRDNIFSVPYENLLSLGNITYYVRQLIYGMSWPLAILFLLGLYSLLRSKEKGRLFLLVWIGLPYIIMTFLLFSKESRYFLPVMPAVAIVSAYFFLNLKKNVKLTSVVLVIFIGLFFWVETSWGYRMLPAPIYKSDVIRNIYGYKKISPEKVRYGFTYPTSYQDNIAEIVHMLNRDFVKQDNAPDNLKIAVVPNSIFLTAQQIQYYARLSGLDRVENDYTVDYSLSTKIRESDWQAHITDADYLITKTGDQGPKIWGRYLKQVRKEERDPASEIFTQFDLVESWNLAGIEDKAKEASLYRNRK